MDLKRMFKGWSEQSKQGRENQEVDFTHHVVIDHLLFAYPDDFTSCGQYPDYSSSESFNDVLKQAEEEIGKLDLDENSAGVFDQLVQLKAYQLLAGSLVETRLFHHRMAQQLLADRMLQLDNLRSGQALIEEQLAEINAEIARLQMERK